MQSVRRAIDCKLAGQRLPLSSRARLAAQSRRFLTRTLHPSNVRRLAAPHALNAFVRLRTKWLHARWFPGHCRKSGS